MAHPPHFTASDAAERYLQYRPKVHGIAVQWLRGCVKPWRRFVRALDIACGTGDSMQPLAEVADHVEGIDASPAMVDVARRRGLDVAVRRCTDLQSGNFDLLSVCMAFHWFDRFEAVAGMKRASADRSVWLVYNFALAGNDGNAALDRWLKDDYLRMFPAPARGDPRLLPEGDSELTLLGRGEGALQVPFSRDALVGYLTTQTNVEAAVKSGRTYEDVEHQLRSELPEFEADDRFRYAFSYSVVLYEKV